MQRGSTQHVRRLGQLESNQRLPSQVSEEGENTEAHNFTCTRIHVLQLAPARFWEERGEEGRVLRELHTEYRKTTAIREGQKRRDNREESERQRQAHPYLARDSTFTITCSAFSASAVSA